MPTCTQCSSELPAGSRFCPACGATQSSVSQMPTAVATPTPPPGAHGSVTTPVGRLDSSAGSAGSSFQAGQVLNGRYRIIGLLGRGGMGEVYRADDLELAQPVSLKFLGRGFGERPGMLDRFRDEVRNARQVSHPNICRVHDIGEAEGQYFLSMEYVDGEDLGMLLRRIGRLPRAKADQVARQLCAGLAAAHERGVIHRDLKPSNVMLDGEGRVRITDFGLAVRGEGAGAGDVAGTPAYMAPEQFEGRAATPQTDLYSLGLILCEIYTGRRPLDATTWDGWKSQHSQVEPRSPLELEQDVEEPVARAILRCLEKDPARRPPSALSLAASLPGGDPLAAALAAGETPSPEMVAASGGEGALSSRAAWSLLAGVVAVMGVILAIAPQSSDLGLAPMSRSPVVLESRARDIATALGYSSTPRDKAWWLERDYDPMKWRARREPSTHWRADYAGLGPPVRLHYRQSPRPMEPRSGFAVGADDPPISVTDMVSVSVDSRGRLQSFLAVPPQLDSSAALAAAPPVGALFEYAGLDSARFTEVPPAWVPLPAFDRRREWVGTADWFAGAPLTVTAAWWRDRPVAFQVRGPWVRPQRQETAPRVRRNEFAQVGVTVLFVIVILFGAFSVRRRLSDGRSDWRGGLRLVTFMLLCRALLWVVGAHHTLELGDEFGSFGLMMGVGLMESLFLFSVYLAVEPFVRRHTPELLVGWARVLQGRPGDARVGRDVLVGTLFGVLGTLNTSIVNALPSWLPFAGQTPVPPHMDALAGGLRLAAAYFALPSATLMPAFIVFGVWFLLRLVLRKPLLAAVALALVIAGLSLGAENPTLEVPGALVRGTLLAWVITRHGLLALVAFSVVVSLFTIVPLPIHMDAPYAVQSLVGLALVLALVAWAFRVSLGGRPAFSIAAGD